VPVDNLLEPDSDTFDRAPGCNPPVAAIRLAFEAMRQPGWRLQKVAGNAAFQAGIPVVDRIILVAVDFCYLTILDVHDQVARNMANAADGSALFGHGWFLSCLYQLTIFLTSTQDRIA